MNLDKESVSLDYRNIINIEQHSKRVYHVFRKIRKNHPFAPSDLTNDYFSFCLADIKENAQILYDDALSKSKNGIKIDPLELKKYIDEGTTVLQSNYENTINTYHGSRNDINHDEFEKDKASFKEQAKEQCKRSGELYFSEYLHYLKKEKSDSHTLFYTKVAAFTGAVAILPIIISVISYLHSQTTLAVTNMHQNQIAYAGSLVIDKKYQEMLKKDFPTKSVM